MVRLPLGRLALGLAVGLVLTTLPSADQTPGVPCARINSKTVRLTAPSARARAWASDTVLRAASASVRMP